RVEQDARRLALPERLGGTALREVAEAHLESRRKRGRLPDPPGPGPARDARPRGGEASREARGETQVARRPHATRRRPRRAREGAIHAAQTGHRDLDRHLRARRDLRRAQRRDDARGFGERGDVERAGESLESLTAERDELLKGIEQEAGALTASLDPASIALEKLRIAPRKSDIAIGRVALAWEPWRAGPDGFPRPASTL